jgi:hypothetical protein
MKIFVFLVQATILIYSLQMLQSVWVQHLTYLGHKINEKYLSPKPLLERGWECHTANIKTIQFEVPNFQAAPAEIINVTLNNKIKVR